MIQNVVVVTGGAQNIGAAISAKFASTYQVFIADLNPPSDSLANQQNIHYVNTDITDESSVQALFTQIQQQFNAPTTLVNNAGIAIEKNLAETTLDEWQQVMNVNVTGTFLMSKIFINQCIAHKQAGAIVNIGSIEGLAANPTHAVYGTSKGAVHSLTKNIAIDHGQHGIRCNAIAPGWIDTPFNQSFINSFANPTATIEEIHDLHPLGQLGTAEDIANLAYFLASGEAKFINGQIISIDGGRMAKLPLPKL